MLVSASVMFASSSSLNGINMGAYTWCVADVVGVAILIGVAFTVVRFEGNGTMACVATGEHVTSKGGSTSNTCIGVEADERFDTNDDPVSGFRGNLRVSSCDNNKTTKHTSRRNDDMSLRALVANQKAPSRNLVQFFHSCFTFRLDQVV
jgi:hypothetical protein